MASTVFIKPITKKFNHTSINTKLKIFILSLLFLFACLISFLMFSFLSYSKQYKHSVRNLTVASEFSSDLKRTLDSKMYKIVISGGKDFDIYDPFSDTKHAREIVEKLKETTTNEDSLKRIKNIEQFLHNLDNSIIEIRGTKGYSNQITKLENNIYILTELIEDKFHEYIYFETRNLADIQVNIDKNISNAITYIGIGSVILLILFWIFSIKASNSITKPIKELCENIKKVGSGDFTIRPVESLNDEIITLSQSFDIMVSKIDSLLNDVKKEQENLRITEIKLLQAQINPHFLYNTFDTIIWLAEDNKNDKVVSMITSLSSLFRTTLSNGKDVICLREEEIHVKSYLEIQQTRYMDILDYKINIHKEFYDYTIPKLTLQPLVENALYHGIKNKRGKGLIEIKSEYDDEYLKLIISDNGIGIKEKKLKELNSSLSMGFGLTNVQERIKMYFGDKYGIKVSSIYGEGTNVTVYLPNLKKTNF